MNNTTKPQITQELFLWLLFSDQSEHITKIYDR
jgi:hypothetical protein